MTSLLKPCYEGVASCHYVCCHMLAIMLKAKVVSNLFKSEIVTVFHMQLQ